MYDTIKLLRFPFSVFLLPISLFSFFYIQPDFNYQLILVLIIWHLLVFPSSNGYNSYNDMDDGPIGGLAAPPKPTGLLLQMSNLFDVTAVLLSFIVNASFAFFVVLYILASRLYSYRKIRLKKFPIVGFLIVFIFQGAWVFFANFFALSSVTLLSNKSVIFSAIASSFFIGTVYPITQIYQHQADKNDGVKTLSMMLGKRGTFIFSGLMFSIATLFVYLSFSSPVMINNFLLYIVIMLPATLFFLIWMVKSFKSERHINFKNTMIMLVLSSVLNNIYFILLLLK
ncbi:MAG: UbiA family prenyltransferase [Bacteroidota bacterium]|nr:UbiA family prenyltransferase [Bacteroidota bacterium]MDP3144396.1 UbiA family prenyltransferase [Bacteroidota bacterium]